MIMTYANLFQPFQLGSLELKNRLVMSPMTMNYATEEGYLTEKLKHYYLERAKGGVGLIIVEGTFFTAEGRGYKNQLGLSSRAHADKLKELTAAVRSLQTGAKMLIQIQHAGWRASSKITGLRPVGPSATAPYTGADTARPLTKEEIKGLVEAHIQAAKLAMGAGFDGVDLHCAHGYLVPSFFSPLSNQRSDEYGGDLRGRARLLVEIVEGIKSRLGTGFPVTIKISGDEYMEGGLGLKEMTLIALLAQEAGIDGVTVSAGSVGGRKIGDLRSAHQILRTLPMMTEPGCLVPLAAEIKRALHVPVIAVGRINHPAVAEAILSQGQADLVAMGRPLLADPYLPEKARRGEEGMIRMCIACNEGCYKRIFEQKDIRCAINPCLGREQEIPIAKASRSKKVVVVGAGPAGLEAAHAAWERGHRVVVLESSSDLGGQLRLASIPPGRKEMDRFRQFLEKRLKVTDVELVTAVKATSAKIKGYAPDAVILALGAQPAVQPLPGSDPNRWVSAWDVLAGRKGFTGPFVVLGGGLTGCEVADYLSAKGEKVCIVEILPDIAAGSDGDTKAYFDLRFKEKGVAVYTEAGLIRAEEGKAIIEQGGQTIRVLARTIVSASGVKPNNGLYDELRGLGIPVLKIGDCAQPRNILEAVWEGFEAGRSL
jgi:2,4-dienoyl-CoA reductase-like NADH-dependent reductase (Old Yellow Enzyme family)/thioredoxin reductase